MLDSDHSASLEVRGLSLQESQAEELLYEKEHKPFFSAQRDSGKNDGFHVADVHLVRP